MAFLMSINDCLSRFLWGGSIRLRGVTILLDKNSYEQRDTLKARVIADTPGANVLFTQEASGEILRRDIITINEQSKEISIPIEKKHVPNFFLAAALVQDYEVYQAQAEVFVRRRELLSEHHARRPDTPTDINDDASTRKGGPVKSCVRTCIRTWKHLQ